MINFRNSFSLGLTVMIIVFNSGQCEPNTDGLNIYKDLIRPANSGDGLVNVEEDYIQLLPPFFTDYDPVSLASKRSSSKFKNYMLGKDAESSPVDSGDAASGPIIRSYIPRTSSKRGPGAILNWAFTPQQQRAGRFYSGYYRSQAHHRPAALE